MAAQVTVAGSGVLGLTTALALADAGCRVTVCDPAPLGANASGVAAGMLAPAFEAVLDPAAASHFDLLLAARDLWPALAARAGIALDRAGALAVGDEAWLATVEAGLAGLCLDAGWLRGEAVRALAPGLSAAFGEAIHTGEDWRLDPLTALAALRRAAQARGVVFRPTAVVGRGSADILVVATGAVPGLAPELSALTPIKGQILRLALERLGGAVVRAEGGYAAPWPGGLAVGATMEVGVDDARTDPRAAAPLISLAETLFPGVGGAAGELKAGVRAATPDGLPMVGASAEAGVLLAVGARRNGWLLAPLVARTIAAMVSGARPDAYAARLSPARFSLG